jgi:hypothetical protein
VADHSSRRFLSTGIRLVSLLATAVGLQMTNPGLVFVSAMVGLASETVMPWDGPLVHCWLE